MPLEQPPNHKTHKERVMMLAAVRTTCFIVGLFKKLSSFFNKIEIHKVEGDVVISQDQKGGSKHIQSIKNLRAPKRKWTIISLIGFVSFILTILAYFGINISSNIEEIKATAVKQFQVNADTLNKNEKVIIPEKAIKGNKMLYKKVLKCFALKS